MKNSKAFSIMTIVLFVAVSSINAQTAPSGKIAGEWKATWNTAIGVMNNEYTFAVDKDVLSGKVVVEANNEKSESEITDGKIAGDSIKFSYQFQGSIKMAYKGKITGDEISFKRDAGGFAVEEAVAKRVIK
jgi:hypothetical protein